MSSDYKDLYWGWTNRKVSQIWKYGEKKQEDGLFLGHPLLALNEVYVSYDDLKAYHIHNYNFYSTSHTNRTALPCGLNDVLLEERELLKRSIQTPNALVLSLYEADQ